MDKLRYLGSQLYQNLSSLAKTNIYKGYSFSTLLNPSLTTDKTVAFSGTTLKTATLLHTFQPSKVVEIKLGNQIIPIKVSSLVKRLGWTKEQVKSLEGRKNSYQILQEAFAIKETLDSIPDPDSADSADSPRRAESFEDSAREDLNPTDTENTSILTQFYKSHEFSCEETSSILEFFLEHLPDPKPSLIFTQTLSHVIVLDPETLEAKIGKQLGMGADAAVFNIGDSNTVLKTYSKTAVCFPAYVTPKLIKDSKIKQKVNESDPLFNKVLSKEHSLGTIAKQGVLTQEGIQLHINTETQEGPLVAIKELKGECDLDQFIKENKDSNTYHEKILTFQKDIAAHYADRIHSRGVVHLDGKPANYMLYKTNTNDLTARVNDFGGSIEIDFKDATTPLPQEEEDDFKYTHQYTPKQEIDTYKKQAKNINELIKKKDLALTPKIKTQKKLLLENAQKIDIFQMGVAFYQMACKSAITQTTSPEGLQTVEVDFPYEIQENRTPNPPTEAKTKETKEKLEKFYGKDDPRVNMILRMIDFDPKNRPTAQEVAKVFDQSQSNS